MKQSEVDKICDNITNFINDTIGKNMKCQNKNCSNKATYEIEQTLQSKYVCCNYCAIKAVIELLPYGEITLRKYNALHEASKAAGG